MKSALLGSATLTLLVVGGGEALAHQQSRDWVAQGCMGGQRGRAMGHQGGEPPQGSVDGPGQ